MAVAEDLPVTKKQTQAGTESGDVLASRLQQEDVEAEEFTRPSPEQLRKAGEFRIETLKKAKPFRQPREREEVKPGTVEVGTETTTPVLIKDTPGIRKLKKTDPKLFGILEKQGITAYKRAVKREEIRFKKEMARIERETDIPVTTTFAFEDMDRADVREALRVQQAIREIKEPALKAAEYKSQQARLKEQYDNYQKLPFWQKLFTDLPVYKSRDGVYIQLLTGEAPAVGAKVPKPSVVKRLVKTLNHKDVKMSKVQFSRFIKARVDAKSRGVNLTPELFKASEAMKKIAPKIDWDALARRFAQDIKKGQINKPKDIARWVDGYPKKAKIVTPALTPAQKARQRAIIEQWAKQLYQPKRTAKDIQREIKRNMNLVKKRGATRYTEQQRRIIEITEAARRARGINPVLRPSETVKIKFITAVDIGALPEVFADTNLQPLQKLTVDEWAQVSELVNTGVKAQAKAQAQGKTRTQTSTSVENAIQNQNKAQTKPLTQTQVKVIQQAVTKTTIPTRQAKITKPITPGITPAVTPTPKPRLKAPGRPVKPRFFDRQEDNARRRMIQRAKGAIAWRQGQLHGKDRWDVVTSPFTQEENYTIVLGRKPVGVTFFAKGPRSAFKTAQLIFGPRLKKAVVVNQPGIFSTILEPSGTKAINLTFTRDIEISKKVGSLEEKGKVFPLP